MPGRDAHGQGRRTASPPSLHHFVTQGLLPLAVALGRGFSLLVANHVRLQHSHFFVAVSNLQLKDGKERSALGRGFSS